MKLTAVYEREPDGRWTVKVPEVKGCHTYGRTIDQARQRIMEALGLFVVDVDRVELVDDVRLPAALNRAVQAARRRRERVAAEEQIMVQEQWRAVMALREMKLGHRDAGRILGLSHQRILQLEQKRASELPGAVIEQQQRARARHAVKRAAKKR